MGFLRKAQRHSLGKIGETMSGQNKRRVGILRFLLLQSNLNSKARLENYSKSKGFDSSGVEG